jgi:FKBP-type peptidyl-prolyl cis-trans isomerase SlyD
MSIQIISFQCILKNKVGHILSTTINKNVINSTDGEKTFLRGLVDGLQNLSKGEKRTIHLSAEEAYGFYDPNKVALFPRKKINKEQSLQVGETVFMLSKTGITRTYRIVEIYGDMVALDSNHPLAGQDLVFEVEILDAREATSQELVSINNSDALQALH